jgi:hypothetical protein
VIAGVSGVPRADAAIRDSVARLDLTVAEDVGGTHRAIEHGTHIVSVSDPDDEVRTVVRLVVGALRDGVPLDRMAILFGANEPYARLVHEQLAAAGIPHNGVAILNTNLTDSLLRIHASISRQKTQTVDTSNIITGLRGSGEWVQVGRNALPLFDAGLVGTQRQTLYLHTSPLHDVTNFGRDILFPVLVRDADFLGIYKALGVSPTAVTQLRGPRFDIINAINLGRSPAPPATAVIPIADGYTGDVITLDVAVDSRFPNGRMIGGGSQPNMNQVNVNSVLLSLIVAGNPGAGLARGVETNDKDYNPNFPFLAPANQGLYQGHGGNNASPLGTPPAFCSNNPCP